MHGLLGLLFAFCHDAHKIALHHHRAYAINMGNGVAVNLRQSVANEVAMVRTSIRWTHHPTMQHAWHAHIVNVNQVAKDLGGHVDTWGALAHGMVLLAWL